jgi:hypothetical protein
MRRFISLTFYLLIIAVGSWAVYEWLVFGGMGRAFVAGGFLALYGVYLLWEFTFSESSIFGRPTGNGCDPTAHVRTAQKRPAKSGK